MPLVAACSPPTHPLGPAAVGPWLLLILFFPSLHPGGRQSKYAINAFEVFDTETRSWTKFPNIPNKRAFSSFVPTEDKLFSLGGLRQGRLYRQPKFMRTVDVFDFEQGGRSQLCPGPWVRVGAYGVVPMCYWGEWVGVSALTCWLLWVSGG